MQNGTPAPQPHPAEQKAALLHALTLLEHASSEARKAMCVSDEHRMHAAAPSLVLAGGSNGDLAALAGRIPNATGQAYAQAEAMKANAIQNLSAVINLAQRIAFLVGAAKPPEEAEHE